MPGARPGVGERKEGGGEESRREGGAYQFSTTDGASITYTDVDAVGHHDGPGWLSGSLSPSPSPFANFLGKGASFNHLTWAVPILYACISTLARGSAFLYPAQSLQKLVSILPLIILHGNQSTRLSCHRFPHITTPPLSLGCGSELLDIAFKPFWDLALAFLSNLGQLLLFSLPITAPNFLPQRPKRLLPLGLSTGWNPFPIFYCPEKFSPAFLSPRNLHEPVVELGHLRVPRGP